VLLLQKSAGESWNFKKYRIVKASGAVNANDHFNSDMDKRKVKSDLIIEVCEDAKETDIATIEEGHGEYW